MVRDPLKDLGDRVKARRTELGYSIDELSKESRVSAKHIENIETANRAELPEPAYLIGFLGLIFKALNLDHEKMVEDFKENDSNYVVQQIVNESEAAFEKEKSKKFAVSADYFKIYHLYIFALIVILVLGFTMLRKRDFSIPTAPQEAIQQPITAPEAKVVEEVKETVEQAPKPVVKELTKEEKKEAEKLKRREQKRLEKERKEQEKREKELREQAEREQKEREKREREKAEADLSQLETTAQAETEELQAPQQIAKVITGQGVKSLNLKVTQLAWVQVKGIDQGKVLFEGDVYPNQGPNELSFSDNDGFIVATGNAGGFLYSTGGAFQKLGEPGQLMKRYFPLEARDVYLQKQAAPVAASFEKVQKEEENSNGSIF